MTSCNKHLCMAVIWPNYYGRQHPGSIRGVTTAGMVVFAALGPLPFGRGVRPHRQLLYGHPHLPGAARGMCHRRPARPPTAQELNTELPQLTMGRGVVRERVDDMSSGLCEMNT